MKNFILFFLLFIPVLGWAQEEGVASFYAHKFKGRKTSNGQLYHPDSLTCAHKTFPFGTLLLVTNPVNGYEVIVRVNDRGPHVRNRIIDLSYSAAERIDIVRRGLAQVTIMKLDSLPYRLRKLEAPLRYIDTDTCRVKLPQFDYKTDYHLKKVKKRKRFLFF